MVSFKKKFFSHTIRNKGGYVRFMCTFWSNAHHLTNLYTCTIHAVSALVFFHQYYKQFTIILILHLFRELTAWAEVLSEAPILTCFGVLSSILGCLDCLLSFASISQAGVPLLLSVLASWPPLTPVGIGTGPTVGVLWVEGGGAGTSRGGLDISTLTGVVGWK